MDTATEDTAPNKSVHFLFLGGGLLLFFLLNWTVEWAWSYFARNPPGLTIDLISLGLALVIGIALYKNDRVYGLADDVTNELKKVTWPTRKETSAATIVVIVTVIIAAIILGSFDMVWSWATDKIYG